MYCAELLDEDWNTEFLAEVVPLNHKNGLKRTFSADSDGGFEIEPGTLSEKIANRTFEAHSRKKKSLAYTKPDEADLTVANRHRARSIDLRQKEERLVAMERALLEEQEKLRQERELLSKQKSVSILEIEEFEEFKANHKRIASYVSSIEEDTVMLRELGFVVDPDDYSVSEFIELERGDSSESGGSFLDDLKQDSEEVNATTCNILKKLQNMQRELDANPFLSFTENPNIEAPTFE